MSRAIYFVQECPTCGRQLHVRVEYLGKLLACEHCRGRFQAADPDSRAVSSEHNGASLMDRVDQLLSAVDVPRVQRR